MDTDVILGLGYDASLGDKIGITIIATGFEYKDPFKREEKPAAPKKEEKIVMPLQMPVQEAMKQQESRVADLVPNEKPLVETVNKNKTEIPVPDRSVELEPRLVEVPQPVGQVKKTGPMVVMPAKSQSRLPD